LHDAAHSPEAATRNGIVNGQSNVAEEEELDNIPAALDSEDTSQRLEALARERDALRQEVTQLRQSLEQIQEKHLDETSDLQTQLEETQQGKESAEAQYKNLLGKVNTIRSQLTERLKADAVSLRLGDRSVTLLNSV
jgi:uncharacterized protein YPO0396